MTPTPEMSELLAQLAELDAPGSISWWPPAWGWWLSGVALTMGLFAVSRYLRLRLQRRKWRGTAQLRLRELEQRAAAGESVVVIVSELSALIRRVTLLHKPRQEIARLHGDAWLDLLDRESGTNQFSSGVGRNLVDVPYRGVEVSQGELTALFTLTRSMFDRQVDPTLSRMSESMKHGAKRA